MIDLAPIRRRLRRLEKAEGRIARRNARRAVFGALRSVKAAIDREYPSIADRSKPSRRERAVKSWPWRRVEYSLVKPGRRKWDHALAERFNAWFCQREKLTVKPIRFDVPDGARFLGRHDSDAIRLKGIDTRQKGRDSALWRTFLHEMAHYRGYGHGAKWKAELLRVYQLWREFRRTNGGAQ